MRSLLLAPLLLLAACKGGQTQYRGAIEKADELCAHHRGASEQIIVYNDALDETIVLTATCADGKYVTIKLPQYPETQP